ncbi:zinc finger BED domain-containing protein RICESLEEPER 2-like [Pistacia vera]|uniref:zinc finger BED domain-containing protein RICESLEEPER 2-like n=1 Tax=Pistacia vera TaxID=55513 RepID=UPI00126399EF|nr:zinc finger BED domain-containing protein RICESLEEPER 2-like [Pistacia vera]
MQPVEDIFETWSDDDATPIGTPGDGVDVSTPRTKEEQVNPFQRKKQPKTSAVWNKFKEKRVLNFVHIPAPRPDVEIAATIHKCLIEWGIENKVFSISVDNVSSNDAAMKILRENLGRNKKLVCGKRLFHVRCTTHILNLMVQDGLSQIKPFIQDLRDCILYVKQSETRAIMFLEIVQMLQLPKRKLILDWKTRWNSTYQILTLAIQYRDVFPMLVQLDNNFNFAPIDEDWEKLKKVCEILEAFNSVTNVISGSEYPTSNLFLQEIVDIKELLDEKCYDDDDFIRSMVGKMKEKFDKYWGERNFVMAIAAVLDPRLKMRLLQFAYPQMYPDEEAQEKIDEVQAALYEIYEEYAAETQSSNSEPPIEISKVQRDNVQRPKRTSSRFCQFVRTTQTVQHEKSELDRYLEEKCLLWEEDDTSFDALQWWKVNQTNYRILSMMAHEILVIPITTVASKATFSAGSRVIDTYRSLLSPDTVQVLLCGGDWCHNLYGVKKSYKINVNWSSSRQPTEPNGTAISLVVGLFVDASLLQLLYDLFLFFSLMLKKGVDEGIWSTKFVSR